VARPDPAEVLAAVGRGEYAGDETRTFRVRLGDGERVGLIVLEDLADPSPTTDFRVRSAHRGRGIGERMVRWAAEHVFTQWPVKPRLKGQTRADNAAMRRVFRRCGWVKEAYYRRSWPVGDGVYVDSVGYAILKEDWAGGKVTPVEWDDEPRL
jgi:RimJ/RimL family protein N-acetyltransferase